MGQGEAIILTSQAVAADGAGNEDMGWSRRAPLPATPAARGSPPRRACAGSSLMGEPGPTPLTGEPCREAGRELGRERGPPRLPRRLIPGGCVPSCGVAARLGG